MALKDTLELLAIDESASETEREHAKRLLGRLNLHSVKETRNHISKHYFTVRNECSTQILARLARHVDAMPVFVCHDEDGWFMYGDEEDSYGISVIMQDLFHETEKLNDKKTTAYYEAAFKHVFNNVSIVKSDIGIPSGFDIASPSISKIGKRDARFAEKEYKKLHQDCTS